MPHLVRHSIFAIFLLALSGAAPAAGFDHQHAAWSDLLKENVVEQRGGVATGVRYAAIKRDRAALQAYLKNLSAVKRPDYANWSKPQQLAFLINAYNAYTVELILTEYPNLKSIKDLGSLLSSPWKKKFVPLLGQTISLDDLEHGVIRKPGAFDDPRIHAAVNCASVGCPALRFEAFVAETLDAQLDDSLSRFLDDDTRNRFDARRGVLEVSAIFDWYREDFSKGHKGYDSLKTLFARHADKLADTASAQEAIREGRYKRKFLDYDWSLNDAR
ncbi:MAG: DUF547 domain-containing protein [Panacagrimonas sp.]